MIYLTNVTKEDFKRAYADCLKSAWVFHNQANFKLAVKWQEQHLLTYNLKSEIETEDDYETDASSIDLFEVVKQAYETENDQEKLARWNEYWADEQGFDVVSYAGDAIIDGNQVGEYARKYFDYQLESINQKGFDYQSISFEQYSFKDALVETQKVLDTNKQVKYLYEAAFEFDNNNLRTRCDILELNGNNHVNLYEVKATSKVKPEHFFDVAYQVFVLEKNGFKVDNVYLVTLNPEYVYGFDHLLVLKDEGNDLTTRFANLTYQEVLDDIEQNQLLKPFENNPSFDLEINKVFLINEFYKTKKGSTKTVEQVLSFIDAYKILDQSIGLNQMMMQLSKCFSDDEQSSFKFLQKEECSTLIDFKWDKAGMRFVYKTAIKPVYCHHVLKWYDKTKDTVFNLTGDSGFNKHVKASIFYQTGKIYLDEIPNLESLNLLKADGSDIFREAHYRIMDVYKQKQQHHQLKPKDLLDINHLEILKNLLNQYNKVDKVYMYDFETAKWALPRFNYSKTYQQIPFQYSVDVIHDDKYDYHHPETMYHHDFISSKLTDPRPDFIVHLINDLLIKHGDGVYVAYNKSFEQMVLKNLAVEFPKYQKPLLYIANHTIDLMDFFKGKKADEKTGAIYRPWFLIYHPDFHGSYSIKKTQPALDSSLSYADLTINKGDKASQTFREYVDGMINPKAWKTDVEPMMVKYCNRDTLAMVVILKQVNNLVKEYELGVKYE